MFGFRNTFFYVLFFASALQAAQIGNAGDYLRTEQFFINFYNQNFKTQRHLFDNQYFSSNLVVLSASPLITNSLGAQLEESKALEEIENALLTTFAYAKPTKNDKKVFASKIYEYLRENGYAIFAGNLNPGTYSALLSLKESCGVGGAERSLIIVHGSQLLVSDYLVPVAYEIRSDVCD